MKKIKIGNTEFDNIVLGPMAGVTDLPFRLICKEMGAGFTFTEMVSAKAILFNNKNTAELLALSDRELPSAIQLFGSDPSVLAEAAGKISGLKHALLDINMGCPVQKVVNNGEGSALMKDPGLIERIVREVSLTAGRPVSVKIRKGFEKDNCSAVECALAAEQGGAKLVTVHGRTRDDFYSGTVDREIIRKVKEAVKVPVIASGDIFTAEDAVSMLNETKVDGVMVARGAEGNPWIFRQIKSLIETGSKGEDPGISERIEMLLRHARDEIAYKGEDTGIREMRKHVAWYMSGFKGAVKIRAASNYISSYKELETIMNDVRKAYEL